MYSTNSLNSVFRDYPVWYSANRFMEQSLPNNAHLNKQINKGNHEDIKCQGEHS